MPWRTRSQRSGSRSPVIREWLRTGSVCAMFSLLRLAVRGSASGLVAATAPPPPGFYRPAPVRAREGRASSPRALPRLRGGAVRADQLDLLPRVDGDDAPRVLLPVQL